MNNVPDQNGKKLEEILAGSNSDAVKTIESSASCHFRVTWSRDCYKWISRLRRHIQIGA